MIIFAVIGFVAVVGTLVHHTILLNKIDKDMEEVKRTMKKN